MYTIYVDDILIYDDRSVQPKHKLISPSLTLKRNNSGTLNITVPQSNAGYGNIEKLKSTLNIYRDNDQIWRGRVLVSDEDFQKRQKFTCEGALSFLNDTVQTPRHFEGTVRQFLESVLTHHNNKVDNDRCIYVGEIEPAINLEVDIEYESTYSLINRILFEDTRFNAYGMKITYDAELAYLNYKSYYKTSQQTIEFGKNMLDFSQNYDMSEVITVLIPLGKEDEDGNKLTVESVNDGSIYIINEDMSDIYGRIEAAVEWSDIDNAQELKNAANEYITDVQFDNMTLEITAIDLHLTDKTIAWFDILDDVKCLSRPHGLNKTFPITQLDIDLVNPANTVVTLGYENKKTISQMVSKQTTKEEVQNNITTEVNTVIRDELPEIGAEIVQADVIKSDTMQAIWCFSRYILTQFLETNFEALETTDHRSVRHYIRIHDDNLEVLEDTLDQNDVEWYHDPGGTGLYWTAVTGANAKKYFTYQSPTTINKSLWPSGMTEEEFENLYKVWVKKTLTSVTKATFRFPTNAQGTAEPELVFGAGDGQGYGQARFFKDNDGFRFVYGSRTSHNEIGIKMDDTGVYVTQDGTNWILIGDDGGAGGADSPIGAVKIVDGAITSSDIEDGYNVYVAYDPSLTPYIEGDDVNILQVTSDAVGHGVFVKREKPITPATIYPETLYLASYENETNNPEFYCYPEGGDEVTFALETDVTGITLTQLSGNEMSLTIPAGITTSGTITITARGVNDTSIFGEMTIPFINAKPEVVGLSNIVVTHRSDPYEYDGQTRTQNSYQATCEVQCDLLSYYDSIQGFYLGIYSDDSSSANITSHTDWVITGTTATCTVEFYCAEFGEYYRAFPFVAATSYQSSDVYIAENLPD